jgi:MFS family permease
MEQTYLTSIVEGEYEEEAVSSHNSSNMSPSKSYSTIESQQKPAGTTVKISQVDSFAVFKEEVSHLMANRDYLILFLVFSIGVGFFNAILTLLNQIVAPFGYSNDDAGTFGAVFILAGLVGAGIMGKIMESTKAYKTILRVGIGMCCITTTFTLLMLFSNNFWPLTIAWALMGMFILPLLPVMMENCSECTYPVPEDISMGILFAGCNVLGLGFIFSLQVNTYIMFLFLFLLNLIFLSSL